MNELMNLESDDICESKPVTGSCFSIANSSDAMLVAKTLSYSSMVPNIFNAERVREHVATANCMIALDMAMRLKMSPLMVMQNLYIVNGRPSWSAAFLVAAINRSGLFQTPLRYKVSGDGDDLGCTAYAIDHSGEVLESTRITIQMAKKEGWYSKSGSKWPNMPEQMLKYRAASFFCRTYCPDVALGMHTQEECYDMDMPSPEERQQEVAKKREQILAAGKAAANIPTETETVIVPHPVFGQEEKEISVPEPPEVGSPESEACSEQTVAELEADWAPLPAPESWDVENVKKAIADKYIKSEDLRSWLDTKKVGDNKVAKVGDLSKSQFSDLVWRIQQIIKATDIAQERGIPVEKLIEFAKVSKAESPLLMSKVNIEKLTGFLETVPVPKSF